MPPTDPDPARPDPVDLWAPAGATPAPTPQPDPAPPDRPAPGRLRFGGRGRAAAFGRPADAAPGPAFPLVRNGYEPAEVDRRIAELTARLAAAEEQRADTAHRLAAERRRGEQVEQELSEVRATAQRAPTPAAAPDAAALRNAERILVMADDEARGVRARAAAEAATLLQRVHAEAEAHRREVERDLAARRAELEAVVARAVAAREQEAAAALERARDDAAKLRLAAGQEIDALHRAAEEALAAARAEGERAAGRPRLGTAAEVERLEAVRRGVRDELAGLHRRLLDELERPAPAPSPVRPVASRPLAAGSGRPDPAPGVAGPEPVPAGRG